MKTEGPVKVLIIDASTLFGRVLAAELQRAADLRVVASAPDATQARQALLHHQPDVILLDLDLPADESLPLLRNLRRYYPVPVIALCGRAPQSAARAMQAVAAGVLDVLEKPALCTPNTIRALATELAPHLRIAAVDARVPPVRRAGPRARAPSFRAAGIDPARHLIVIGASTGGPETLRTLLAQAPPDFPPVAIVQHMPAGFTASFADRLNHSSALTVREARDGDLLTPGHAVVARGDTHLVVRRAGDAWRVHYTHQQPVNRHCPSVDVLFESAVVAAGRDAIGIQLTGMGDDGARGLLKLRQAGAITIAQDRTSCVVYGMPKVAVELGAARHQARPDEIPALVHHLLAARPVAASASER